MGPFGSTGLIVSSDAAAPGHARTYGLLSNEPTGEPTEPVRVKGRIGHNDKLICNYIKLNCLLVELNYKKLTNNVELRYKTGIYWSNFGIINFLDSI